MDTISTRQFHRDNSPKLGGSSDFDSLPYLNELGVQLYTNEQPIKFFDNRNEFIHRWTPYVQGFSAAFVQSQLDLYKRKVADLKVLDPFAGCGTVLVQSKLNGIPSCGTELNPLLQFIADIKLRSWKIIPQDLLDTYKALPKNVLSEKPDFLENGDHFKPEVLQRLQTIKGGIDTIDAKDDSSKLIKDILLVAFASILIDSSNLVRSPCLGYSKTKVVSRDTPNELMDAKVTMICKDIYKIQQNFSKTIDTRTDVILANAKTHDHDQKYNLVITSPPYMNGLDYVMNYKIEMAWLGFADSQTELKRIKDDLVVCDNVSKGLIKKFDDNKNSYTNSWIEVIKRNISNNIATRGSYRRTDMPSIIHKYFDDMYQVFQKVDSAITPGGKFVLVVGDSLIADVYIPTDLLLAKIGKEMGFSIEKIEKARARRSGQIRSYTLRETIITLSK